MKKGIISLFLCLVFIVNTTIPLFAVNIKTTEYYSSDDSRTTTIATNSSASLAGKKFVQSSALFLEGLSALSKELINEFSPDSAELFHNELTKLIGNIEPTYIEFIDGQRGIMHLVCWARAGYNQVAENFTYTIKNDIITLYADDQERGFASWLNTYDSLYEIKFKINSNSDLTVYDTDDLLVGDLVMEGDIFRLDEKSNNAGDPPTDPTKDSNLAGKTFTQRTVAKFDYDIIPSDWLLSEIPPYLQFIDNESGLFQLVDTEYPSTYSFKYTVVENKIHIYPDPTGKYSCEKFHFATELVMECINNNELRVYAFYPNKDTQTTLASGQVITTHYALGWTDINDIFEFSSSDSSAEEDSDNTIDLLGKRFLQITNVEQYNPNDLDHFPYIEFISENSGKINYYSYNDIGGSGGTSNFSYTISGDKVILYADYYYIGKYIDEIELRIINQNRLEIVDIKNYRGATGVSLYGSDIGDVFEIQSDNVITKEEIKPTISGVKDSYTITQGDSLTISGTLSASGDGLLNKVTLKHNLTGTTFEPMSITIDGSASSVQLDEYFKLSANSYPLNTVGTHEFTIYASADNYTATNNLIKKFTVTVEEKKTNTEIFALSKQGKKILMNLEGAVLDENGNHMLYDDDKNYSNWNRPTIGYGTLISDLSVSKASDYNSLLYKISNGKYSKMQDVKCQKGIITISNEEAEKLFEKEVKSSEDAVNAYIKNNSISLEQHQFDALVMWFYNLGNSRLKNNPNCRLAKVLNGEAGLNGEAINDATVKEAFTTWCLCGGVPLSGLVKRNLIQANIFLYGYKGNSTTPEDYYSVSERDQYLNIKEESVNNNNDSPNPSIYVKKDSSSTLNTTVLTQTKISITASLNNSSVKKGDEVVLNAHIGTSFSPIEKITIQWYEHENLKSYQEEIPQNCFSYDVSYEIDTNKCGSGIYRVYAKTTDGEFTYVENCVLTVLENEKQDQPISIYINDTLINGKYENKNNSKLKITVKGLSDKATYAGLQLTSNTHKLPDIYGSKQNNNFVFYIEPKSLSEGTYKLAVYSGSDGVTLDSEVLINAFTIKHYEVKSSYTGEILLKIGSNDYVNKEINAQLYDTNHPNYSKIKETLDEGKNAIFFFEGAGNDLDTTKRMAALCVVIKKNGSGNYYVAGTWDKCTTIPDYYNDKPNVNRGNSPIVIDGIYDIYTWNHPTYEDKKDENGNKIYDKDGNVVQICYKYASMKINNNGQPIKVLRVYNDEDETMKEDTTDAINIHARSSNNIPAISAKWVNSAGCFNIGKIDKEKDEWFTEYNDFIRLTTGFDKIARANEKKNNKVHTELYIDIGVVIVNRQLYRDELVKIYGNEIAVNKILGGINDTSVD